MAQSLLAVGIGVKVEDRFVKREANGHDLLFERFAAVVAFFAGVGAFILTNIAAAADIVVYIVVDVHISLLYLQPSKGR